MQFLFGIQWAGVKATICPTAAKGPPSFCLAKGSQMPLSQPDSCLASHHMLSVVGLALGQSTAQKMQLASGADLDIFPVIMLVICAYFYNVWYWPMDILIFTLQVILMWVYPSGLWTPWGQGHPFRCPWADNWPRTMHCAAAQDSAMCPWHLVISPLAFLHILALLSLHKALRDGRCFLVFSSWFLVLCFEESRCSISTYWVKKPRIVSGFYGP